MDRFDCEAILFDLDGVLVDSTPSVERVWQTTLPLGASTF